MIVQSVQMAALAHGYTVSFTLIGGTEDEVEESVEGLSFGAVGKAVK